jgi:hypothetical protein
MLAAFARAQEARLPAALPQPAPATAYSLSLDDAKRLAVANNTGISLGQLGVQEKSVAVDAARRDYLAKLLANFYYFHSATASGKSKRFALARSACCRWGSAQSRPTLQIKTAL